MSRMDGKKTHTHTRTEHHAQHAFFETVHAALWETPRSPSSKDAGRLQEKGELFCSTSGTYLPPYAWCNKRIHNTHAHIIYTHTHARTEHHVHALFQNRYTHARTEHHVHALFQNRYTHAQNIMHTHFSEPVYAALWETPPSPSS